MKALVRLLTLCAMIVASSRWLPAETRIQSRDTVAHELLKVEYEAVGQSEVEYKRRLEQLNRLIDESVARIERLKVDDKTHEGIKSMFREVHQVLVDNHYQLKIPTESLWDTLAPRSVGGDQAYQFDCDTGSMIYLGVFDRLKKPVCMVETKKHNFVRWRLSPSEHLNWDVNDAKSYTDDEHRAGVPLTAPRFDKETETRNHFLLDMTTDEIKAYHWSIAATQFKDQGQFDKAIVAYERSIQGRPYTAGPRNNLAWMIATQPDLQRCDLLQRALEMARSAVSLEPKDDNFIDTLAAVHAARHEFDKAIEVEKGGRNSPERIRAYTEKKTPVELNWRSEPDE